MLRGLAALLFRVRVSGLPAETPRLLVVANHESFLDGLLLGLFLPLDPVFVVHTGVVRNPVFRLLLGWWDYLAVDPTSPMAMKKVIRLIEGGRPVVIFPEGRITTTGSLMKTYDGPAFVAAKTGATILPVRIDGAARTYFSRLAAHVPRKLFPQIGLFLQPTTASRCPGRHRAGSPPQGRRRDAPADAGDDLRQPPAADLFEALLDAAAIHGHGTRLVEDLKQIEYSYRDLIGRWPSPWAGWWPAKASPASGSACCCPTWRRRWRWSSASAPGAGWRPCSITPPASMGCRPPAPQRRSAPSARGPSSNRPSSGTSWPRCRACR